MNKFDTINSTYIKIRISVEGANPNGDPDCENRPRQYPDGRGFITSNSLKMKIKQEMSAYIKNNGITSRDVARIPEAENTMADIFATQKTLGIPGFFEKYVDLKFFGLVAASKSQGVGVSSSGFVFVHDAETQDVVIPIDSGITSCTNDEDVEKKSSNTMGRRHTIGHSGSPVYYDSLIVVDWKKTKYTINDIDYDILLNGIKNMYTNSCSAARPFGAIQINKMVTVDNTGALTMPNRIFDGFELSKYANDHSEQFIVNQEFTF